MKLEKIIKGITVNEIIGDASQEISGINMDSRLIEPGHIFVAVKGTQTDGHTYIQKAIRKTLSGNWQLRFTATPPRNWNWSVLQAPTEKRLLPPYYIICSVNSDIRQDSFPLYAII